MPKSKRDKEISLTKVKKKGREVKEKLVNNLRAALDEYEHLVVFYADAVRAKRLHELRKRFQADSRFFFGNNKVMSVALGRAPSDEYRDNLCKVSAVLAGQCGIMMTNHDLQDVVGFMQQYNCAEYARSGNIACRTVVLEAGPLEQFSFNMEPRLRKLGLPVVLNKGVVTLEKTFTVCNEGDKLTPEQAKILELFEEKLATFRIHLLCRWSRDGSVKVYSKKCEKKKSKKSKAKADELC